ncbi:hypothetical protein [Qipengyuania qiaonensis]|uniref:LPXTG cell wall anchor domain-containing protein n=1 Tax=Qipengyuania qiaonensis TaxID=2867240 RepID=A0ABS7J6U5_9SPHN|nr:hypothetical protein [Qipengyuania qiaonensis]MBX7483035.1 hypothetical protein [Qipengyuania qiaonensis]
MTKTRHMIACAPIAIAAMAALHTPAAMAQETPTIVLDVPAPAPAASPAPVVLPAPAPAPITVELPEPEPVVEAPVVQEAEPVATTQTTRAATREAPAPAPEAPAAPAERGETAISALDTDAAPLPDENALATVATDEVAQPGAAEAVPAQNPVNDTSSAALLFSLLALGGVGLASVLLFRSRRRRRGDEPQTIERPIISATPVEEREHAIVSPVTEPTQFARIEPERPAVPSNGAAVELPAAPPRNPEERDRLLRKLIDAKPDRANPFASHKARAKRARLILQSLGTRFTDRKPTIDLSQYTNVWPELRGWRPATA